MSNTAAHLSAEELEADGLQSEQRLLLRKAADRHRQMKNDELRSLAALHQCKAGVFCLVKQAKLEYLTDHRGDHEIVFVLPVSRLSCVYTVGANPVRLAISKGEQQGSLRCSCQEPDCLYSLLKTLCGLKEALPVA